jgi:hypothetical protein
MNRNTKRRKEEKHIKTEAGRKGEMKENIQDRVKNH